MIERAKGILMERHGVGEREASTSCATTRAAQSRRVVDVALSVTEGHALLPKARLSAGRASAARWRGTGHAMSGEGAPAARSSSAT